MKKTQQLFNKYMSLFLEQEPGEEPSPDEMAPDAPEPETEIEPETKPEISDNEKHVIKILTNSFIFNPLLFSPSQQKDIKSKILEIKNSVNVPISKIVSDVKKIISLDKSLVVESKTHNLIKKYFRLIEQDALDATEPQADTKEGEPSAPAPLAPQENKLNLDEIFPLYKELIISALAHIPTEEELLILRPVVNEFGDVDPQKIVDTIEGILGFATEDDSVEDALSNA